MPDHNKPEVSYGDPISLPKPNPSFHSWPKLPQSFATSPGESFVISLEAIAPEASTVVEESGKLTFHAVGDTGNDASDEMQVAIAKAMRRQVKHAATAEERPAFFYLLGDVVYPLGESRFYKDRFYEPYKWYQRPIVAIAGNHDGYGSQNNDATSLDGWQQHFLGTLPESAWNAYRAPQRLPYVFWELQTPVARIIGLYSNVDGHLDEPGASHKPQQDWLTARLQAAPRNMPVLIMVHHPPYSLDESHGGSPAVADALDTAIVNTAAEPAKRRWPDAVFSGHVHSYQRYTRRVEGREIPYLVAGSGGRAHKRKKVDQFMEWEGHPPIEPGFQTLPRDPALDLQLVAADMSDPGFLNLSIDANKRELRCTYWRVPFDEAQPVDWQDAFTLDLNTHRITNL